MRIRLFLVGLAAAAAVASAGQTAPPQTAPEAVSTLKVAGYFSADYVRSQDPGGGWTGSFVNARGGLLFSGDWSANFGYALEFTLVSGGAAGIEQAWAVARLSEAIQIRAGLYLVPFGRYNESRRPFQTSLVLDPHPVGTLYPFSWRDLGLVLTGRMGRLQYAGYIGNGLAEGETLAEGQQFSDNNRDKGWGGRLSYALTQTLEVGASYSRALVDPAGSRRRKMWGADLAWGSEAFMILGEYAKAEIANPEPFAPGEAEAFFGMVTFKFGPFFPLASYESLTYDDPFHGPGFGGAGSPGTGISRGETRWALGFVYPLHPNFRLKLEYDLNREKDGESRNDILRLQAAVRF